MVLLRCVILVWWRYDTPLLALPLIWRQVRVTYCTTSSLQINTLKTSLPMIWIIRADREQTVQQVSRCLCLWCFNVGGVEWGDSLLPVGHSGDSSKGHQWRPASYPFLWLHTAAGATHHWLLVSFCMRVMNASFCSAVVIYVLHLYHTTQAPEPREAPQFPRCGRRAAGHREGSAWHKIYRGNIIFRLLCNSIVWTHR